MRRLSFTTIITLLAINFALGQSPHGNNLKNDCSECHQSTTWKIDLKKIEFDHSRTNFVLKGQHQIVECRSCHKSLVFSEVSSNCFSCHKDIHQNTVGENCIRCHTTESWVVKDILLIHQSGRFPLLGAHKTADCKQCHTGFSELKFEQLDVECYACHASEYRNTKLPNHVQAGFSVNCQECHNLNAISWNTISVDHSFFPLAGGHSLPNCFSCHQQGQGFGGLSKQCYSCHQATYQSTQNPNHIAAGFPATCESCHNIYGWRPAIFDHSQTAFPLTGKHITAQCSQCHSNGYSNTPTDCYSCHQTDYNNTTNPNHTAVSFPTTCNECHSTNGWQPATFDHDNQFFPIYSGKHRGKWNACSDCHTVPSNYSVFSCLNCHEHNKTSMDSKHQGVQGYLYESNACYSCHPAGRKDGAFNHGTSAFPLVGEHITTQCSQCHQTGYNTASTICSDCHLNEFNSSVNPNHPALSISTECNSCHTPTPNWSPALFPQHNNFYQLLGAHQQINNCNSCHNGNYSTLDQSCITCHNADFQNATNPNHVSQGFPGTCEDCHSFSAWIPSTFDHSQGAFPLTGKHITTQCSQCHSNGYSNTPTDCYSCHQSNYNNTTNPNHQSLLIPTTCNQCHTTNGWQPAAFDHSQTAFPLTGKHITAQCSQCHSNGYSNTPTDCYSCHQTDYNNTTNPNHTAVSFPTTCNECHSTNGWQPATFDHDNQFFPIYSGKHRGKWNACSDCHTVPSNYSVFSCLNCHEHNKTSMDSKHQGVQNYVYESNACLNCHPDGSHKNLIQQRMIIDK